MNGWCISGISSQYHSCMYVYNIFICVCVCECVCVYTHTRASLVAQMVKMAQMLKNPPAMQETWVWSLDWEDPLEEGMATHSSIHPWRIPMDRGAWKPTVHSVTKSQTQLKQLSMHAHIHTGNRVCTHTHTHTHTHRISCIYTHTQDFPGGSR